MDPTEIFAWMSLSLVALILSIVLASKYGSSSLLATQRRARKDERQSHNKWPEPYLSASKEATKAHQRYHGSSRHCRIDSLCSLKTLVPYTLNPDALPFHYGGGLPPPSIPPYRQAASAVVPRPALEKPLPRPPLRAVTRQMMSEMSEMSETGGKVSPISTRPIIRCSSIYDDPPSSCSSTWTSSSSGWSLATLTFHKVFYPIKDRPCMQDDAFNYI